MEPSLKRSVREMGRIAAAAALVPFGSSWHVTPLLLKGCSEALGPVPSL